MLKVMMMEEIRVLKMKWSEIKENGVFWFLIRVVELWEVIGFYWMSYFNDTGFLVFILKAVF